MSQPEPGPPGGPPGVSINIAPDFDGPFFGYSLSLILFGIIVSQGWIYIHNNKDNWMLRSYVVFIIMLDMTFTFLDVQIIHSFLVINFGNVFNLSTSNGETVAQHLIMSLTVFCVQCFFLRRIWLLGKFHWSVLVTSATMSAAALAIGVAAVIQLFGKTSISVLENNTRIRLQIGLEFAFGAVADILATIQLSQTFYQTRNGIKRTDTLLQKMLRFTISRGLLVTIFQIVVLILYLVKPNNLWWIGCYFNLTKVYIITTLAMLNYRSSLHNNVGPVVISDMTFRAKRTQNSTPLYQLEDTCSFQVADEAHNTVEGQKTVSNA